MHVVGQTSALAVLLGGASMVLLDAWSGERGLRVLADSGATAFVAAPTLRLRHDRGHRGEAAGLPALRSVRCVGTTVPKQLVSQVSERVRGAFAGGWGMTEVGAGTMTRSDDPPDWAAHSDGRPVRAMELDLRSDTEITKDQPGRLFVRGSGVCLATVGRDSGALTVIAEHDDGWYDTGDLAVPDGRGGIRLMGRAADRIGGVFMIPVDDVESELLKNPGVEDVALVGYPDEPGRRAGVRGDRPGDRATDHPGRAARVPHRPGHDRVVPAHPRGVRRERCRATTTAKCARSCSGAG